MSRSKKNSGNSELELIKYTQQLVKTQDTFSKVMDEYKNFIASQLQEQLTTIGYNEQRLHDLEKQYEAMKKDKQVELDLYVKEFKRQSIDKFLEEFKERAVLVEDYQRLITDNEQLRQDASQSIDKAVAEERARNKQTQEYTKRTLELQKNAEVAKVTAQLETQKEQIQFLYDTIDSLKKDINAQRELTKDVANAAGASNNHLYRSQNAQNV